MTHSQKFCICIVVIVKLHCRQEPTSHLHVDCGWHKFMVIIKAQKIHSHLKHNLTLAIWHHKYQPTILQKNLKKSISLNWIFMSVVSILQQKRYFRICTIATTFLTHPCHCNMRHCVIKLCKKADWISDVKLEKFCISM